MVRSTDHAIAPDVPVNRSDASSLVRSSPAGRAITVRTVTGLVLRTLLVGVAYYVGTLIGYELIPFSYISVIWPPNTVLLVALLLSPRWQWSWLLLIVFPVHQLAQASFDVSATTAASYYVFACVLVLLTATALGRVGLGDLKLEGAREALAFMVVTVAAVALASLVWSPLMVSLTVGGDRWAAWGQVALSNILLFLIATPSLVIGLKDRAAVVRRASLATCVELVLLISGLVVIPFFVSTLEPGVFQRSRVLFYMPLPFFTWAAARFGPGGLSLTFLLFLSRAVFDTSVGVGPFAGDSPDDRVLSLQIYMIALYVPFLTLAAVVEERRAKTRALSDSEARYRGIVQDQTELICRFLPDGTYTFVNDAYCEYFRRTRDELIGRTFWSFIPPEGHQAAREFLASITPSQVVATCEHEVIAPGGEIRWQQWRDRGFFDDHGRVVEYQAVGRDITERKRLEEASRRLALGARLTAIGELTATIAHEITQPLQSILHNAAAADRMLSSGLPSLSEVREVLADIRRDDLRASEVIQRVRGLLSSSELMTADLDLNEVVQEVVRLVGPDASRRGITLDTTFDAGLSSVRGDRIQLQQVFLNLLLNAMEAMQDSPEPDRIVVIRTEMDRDASVLVSISDTGHGIPSDKLPVIFDSFFTTKEEGLGLGLAIARSIVSAHGGRIWASNNGGRGATFYFTLPGTAHVRAAVVSGAAESREAPIEPLREGQGQAAEIRLKIEEALGSPGFQARHPR